MRPTLDSAVRPQSSVAQARSKGRKVAGAVVGGAAGFFGGLLLGAAIEGKSCHCDDPGLAGALIGAPLGAAVGTVVGYKYLF